MSTSNRWREKRKLKHLVSKAFEAINRGSSVEDVEKFIAGRSPGETFGRALARFYDAKRVR